MSSDSCLLDLKGILSAERQPGPSETQVSLAMSAPSEEFGERVRWCPWGEITTPFKFPFPYTSKFKGQTTHPSTFKSLSGNCPGEQRGWHTGSSPCCCERLCSLPFDATAKTLPFWCAKVILVRNKATTINSCKPYSEQLVFQTWN